MTQDSAEIVAVDPRDERALLAWHTALTDGSAAGREHALNMTFAEMAISLRNPSRFFARFPVVARVHGETVGALYLEFPLTENRHAAMIEIAVPQEFRGRGYGTALFEHGRAAAAADGRHTLFAEVFLPQGVPTTDWPGTRFAERHGLASKHVEEHFVLELPPPVGLLDDLDARAQRPGYTVRSWVGACPDDLVAELAKLRTAMGQDVPVGELDYEPEVWDVERIRNTEQRGAARGFSSIVTVGATGDGELVGYSELFAREHDPANLLQEDTLVLRAHRGNALGTRLKVANLRIAAERFGDRRAVHTWMSTANPAMRAVNAAFGFRAVETMHEYQLG